MTHIKNIPHILRYGITSKNSRFANPDFVNIGDVSLIDTRSKKKVIVTNGEDSFDKGEIITLGDYIPFYFGVRMPTLYVTQHGGNFVERANPAENIVYLACTLKTIIESENTCYFSDGHATDALSTFYDRSKMDELPQIISWSSIRATYWGGTENLNTKRKKQAEFLILDDVSTDHIFGFVCYNDKAKRKLMKMSIDNNRIRVMPDAYY